MIFCDLAIDGWRFHVRSLALVPKMLPRLTAWVAETMLSCKTDLFGSYMKRNMINRENFIAYHYDYYNSKT